MSWIFKKNQFSEIFAALAVIIGLLLVIILGFGVYSLFSKNSEKTERIDSATYQAVFLEGSQIYFGKLRDIDSQYPILEEVYYVKLEGEDIASGRLVKLGDIEPHGPQHQMIINRDHILFLENLKPDSQIVQTIISSKLRQ